MRNDRISQRLEEIADLLELRGGDPFRVRAYRNGAAAVRDLSKKVEDMIEADDSLQEVSGIGESLAEKIRDILRTGTCDQLEDLRRQVPAHLRDFLKVRRLGPRKAMQLHRELGVEDMDDLRKACEEGRVRELEGFGKKSEENILEGIVAVQSEEGRTLLAKASERLDALSERLSACEAIERWQAAGSLRRGRETVGDLDILVVASDREAASEAVLADEEIGETIGRGEEKLSVRMKDGLQVDFRFIDDDVFGAALLYFTGSKAHNIALRKQAVEKDWKLSEYGLFKDDRLLAAKTEEAVYRRFGLTWIPPELREAHGEIEAAARNELPELVEAGDLRGDLHTHTDATDGRLSLDAIVESARRRGFEYLAVTDHSKSVKVAGGLDADGIRAHADAIREKNEEVDDLHLFAGVEVDILKNGSLDLPENVLENLDWVVASAHYHREMSEKRMTERLVAAAHSGVVHSLGHPLGRMIGKREPAQFDFDKVLEACAECSVAMEIDAQPDRMDLPGSYARRARQAGVAIVVVSDAHAEKDFDNLAFGVLTARRAWLRKRDVLNTKTLGQLRKHLDSR